MEDSLNQIMSLMQEGTVSKYCDEFQLLFDQVKYSEEISEYYAIYLFMDGLKPEIRDIFIQWHQYSFHTVKDAISLALKLDTNELRDSFSPFDPNSSFYNKDLEFGINISLKELMKDNEWFKNGKIQETCVNIVQETIVQEVIEEVIDDDVLEGNGYNNKVAFKVFVEMPQGFNNEMNVGMGNDSRKNEKDDDVEVEERIKENVNEMYGNVIDVYSGDDVDVKKFEKEPNVDVKKFENEPVVDVKRFEWKPGWLYCSSEKLRKVQQSYNDIQVRFNLCKNAHEVDGYHGIASGSDTTTNYGNEPQNQQIIDKGSILKGVGGRKVQQSLLLEHQVKGGEYVNIEFDKELSSWKNKKLLRLPYICWVIGAKNTMVYEWHRWKFKLLAKDTLDWFLSIVLLFSKRYCQQMYIGGGLFTSSKALTSKSTLHELLVTASYKTFKRITIEVVEALQLEIWVKISCGHALNSTNSAKSSEDISTTVSSKFSFATILVELSDIHAIHDDQRLNHTIGFLVNVFQLSFEMSLKAATDPGVFSLINLVGLTVWVWDPGSQIQIKETSFICGLLRTKVFEGERLNGGVWYTVMKGIVTQEGAAIANVAVGLSAATAGQLLSAPADVPSQRLTGQGGLITG